MGSLGGSSIGEGSSFVYILREGYFGGKVFRVFGE